MIRLCSPTASGTPWRGSWLYDAYGRATDKLDVNGVQETTGPGTLIKKLSLLNGASINRLYDDMARVTEINFKNSSQAALLSHQYPNFDNASRRLRHQRFDGSYIDYTYDALGQLKTAYGKEAGGTRDRLHEQFTYDYDLAGNVTHRTKNALGTTFTPNNLNELSSASRSGTLTVAGAVNSAVTATSVTVNSLPAELYGDQTFARAGFTLNDGNNTFSTVAQGSGQSTANNLTVYAPQTVTFQYDASGNLTNDGWRGFFYDEENQLTKVTIGTGWKTEFVYDGLGRKRVTRDCLWLFNHWMTNETRYVYDGYCVLQERNGSNQPKATYTRGLDLSGSLAGAGGIGGLLARTANSQLPSASAHAYYFADANGNVTALVNNNLQAVAQYLYDPYGGLIGLRGTLASANLYRFSSKEYHPYTMLYNFGFRHYEPNLHRWTSADPLGEAGGATLYQFVGNDPISTVDPFGLEAGYVYDGGRMHSPLDNPEAGKKMEVVLNKVVIPTVDAAFWIMDKVDEGIDKLRKSDAPCRRGMGAGLWGASLVWGGPETKALREARKAARKLWKLAETTRGATIEDYLAATEYRGWFRVGELQKGKFPLVDFQKGNNLVSLKTVETTGSSWLGEMQKHILDLGTRGATVNGGPAKMILDLRVQPGGAAAAQSLVGYGRQYGVTVIVKEFP